MLTRPPRRLSLPVTTTFTLSAPTDGSQRRKACREGGREGGRERERRREGGRERGIESLAGTRGTETRDLVVFHPLHLCSSCQHSFGSTLDAERSHAIKGVTRTARHTSWRRLRLRPR